MRAVIYCRTAIARQRPDPERDSAIQRQIHTCRAYCAARGYDVGAMIIDCGISGIRLGRPALDQWLSREPRAAVLVVTSITRLGREADVVADITSRLRDHGIRVEIAEGLT